MATIDSLIGYTPAIAQQRRMRKGLREQFQRLPDRKGMWRECSQEGFLRSWHQTRGVSRFYGAIATLHDQCRAILLSKTEKEAREQFRKLRRASTAIREEKRKAVAFLKHHWNHLMMHHRVSGLPRTTNLAEGFNKQLERRLKTIESFQHRSTAQAYSNLLIAYLRQKPYTDCRRRRKQLNGKTRLQAAHVTNLSKSWLQNCLKTPSSSNR